jgi:flagellar hook-associated protein 3 FlgL
MASISTLGQSLDMIARLKRQQTNLGDLQAQISSGKKTQKLSGLGNDVLRDVRSRANINSLEVYIDNIKNAERRLQLMQNSVTQIKAQARNISSGIATANQQGEYPDLKSIQALAENVYNFILDSMNQKDGDRYLFAGGDTSELPIVDTGLYSSYLGNYVPDESDLTNPPQVAAGLIGQWGDGTITSDQFLEAIYGTSDVVLGYSNALTSGATGKTTVRVNDGAEFDYTTLANNQAMRDIVIVLGALKALPPVEHAPGALNNPGATTIAEDTPPNPPKEKQENFFKVLNSLSAKLNKAIDAMDQHTYRLSQVQAQVDIVKTSHTDQMNAYIDIVTDVENVDITEASAKILQIKIQLEASFQVTAMVSQLTLVNFMR